MAFRTKEKLQNRVGALKKTTDGDDARRKREETVFELRKTAKEEQLQKRRAGAGAGGGKAGTDEGAPPTLADIPKAVADCRSDDMARQLPAVRLLRRLLSIQENPPIQPVIASGVVPRVVHLLKSPNKDIAFEAAWALTNIASGTREHTKCVIDNGAIPPFVTLMTSPHAELREQAVWALGNIAGDCAPFRDMVLQANAIKPLMQNCAPINGQQPPITLLRNATWAISNLCRGKPQQPNFEQLRPVIPCLAYLLKSQDEEVLADACWAVSYLTDDSTEGNIKIQAVLQAGVAPMLTKLLAHSNYKIQTPVLRSIGNIVTGTDAQTGEMIKYGVLQGMLPLLTHPKRTIRKEACWAVSNVTAGTSEQIQTVVDANMISPLVKILASDEFIVQKEAAWALTNITNNGKKKQIRGMLKFDVIQALCVMLECGDNKMILLTLEGLDNILNACEGEGTDNLAADKLEECRGLDKIEGLQRHELTEVYKKASSIISKHFSTGDDDEDVNLASEMDSESGSSSFGGGSSSSFNFAFGAPMPNTPFRF